MGEEYSAEATEEELRTIEGMGFWEAIAETPGYLWDLLTDPGETVSETGAGLGMAASNFAADVRDAVTGGAKGLADAVAGALDKAFEMLEPWLGAAAALLALIAVIYVAG